MEAKDIGNQSMEICNTDPDKNPSTSTPKPAQKNKIGKKGRGKKIQGSSSGSSLGQSLNSTKRNRSADQKTGHTPENKRQAQGLDDDAIESFGEFSVSSGLNEEEVSLSEIEQDIISNPSGLKRGSGPTKEEFEPPRKERKMAKRTGIEIRLLKKNGMYESDLETSEWTSVKDSVQEFLFDNGLLEIFGKIVSTPYNRQEGVAYGAITFKKVEEAEEMMELLKKVRFQLPVFMKLVTPTNFIVRFRVYGMLTVDPKKIVNAIVHLNGFKGKALEIRAKTLDDTPECRQFTVTPDGELLQGFRAFEATNMRIKTGFNSTIFRIIDVSTNHKEQE